MPRWFAHAAAWCLLILLGAFVVPRTGTQPLIAGETSAEYRNLARRLDGLERENREMRETLDHYRRLAHRIDRLEVSQNVPTEGTPLRLFDVPASVSFAGERLPLERPDVHQRFEEEWYRFLVNRHWVIKWKRRARDVFPVVEAKLAARGLPEDLKYVLVIESGVEPRATSGAGAVGWWQFIKETGQEHGLRQTQAIDDRRDLDRATDAALDYLERLHEEFGSWPLALAAYNAGPRRIQSTIEDQVTRDYYDMVLPTETEAYWFKAAAVATILSDPLRYQLDLADDGWSPAACDTLEIRVLRKRMDMGEILTASGMTYRQLKDLNPSFRRAWLPLGKHRVVVPRERADDFVTALGGAAKLLGRHVGDEESLDVAETPDAPTPAVASPVEEP